MVVVKISLAVMTEKFVNFSSIVLVTWYNWLLWHSQLMSCIFKVDIVSEAIHALTLLIFALSRVDQMPESLWIQFFFSRAPISILGKHELASMTLTYIGRIVAGTACCRPAVTRHHHRPTRGRHLPSQHPHSSCEQDCSGPFFQPFFLLQSCRMLQWFICRLSWYIYGVQTILLPARCCLSIWFSGPFDMQVSIVSEAYI